MDDPSMAFVTTFAFPHEADLAKALLESAGIPAYLRHENVMRLNIAYAITEGGLNLFVPAGMEEEARELLDSHVSLNDLEAQAEAAGPREDC